MSTTIPTYEALALQLKRLGIECVFGLMSDETATLVASIDAAGLRFITARHENNAVAMAEGYACRTGKLGVVLIGRGPATANGLHGSVYAHKTGTPVLLMVGAGPQGPHDPNELGPDTKSLDTVGVLRAAGLPHMTAHDPASATLVLTQAAAAAQRGLMSLILPMDVLQGQTPAAHLYAPAAPRPPAKMPQVREPAVAAAVEQLKRARRPLILAGWGAHKAGAREALMQLADHLGAALATTMKAKDLFRGHAFDCGVVGSFSHGAGRRLIEQADCVLSFGAGLNQRTTSRGTSLPSEAVLIQVDRSRKALGQWLHCDIGLLGDAKAVAEQLREALPPRTDKPLRSPELAALLARQREQPELDFEASHTPRTIDPRSVGVELDRLLPQDRNMVYDAGNFLQCATYIGVPGPAHIKQASDFSSIGMGFGTAMGFAHGDPERTTVLVIGDGAFLMTLSELETVAREGLRLVVVVMNDCAYGAELHYLKLRNIPISTTQFPDIDYAPVAQAFGFTAATVRTLDELRALAPLLAAPSGPVLIDCKINAAIPAGFLTEAPAAKSA